MPGPAIWAAAQNEDKPADAGRLVVLDPGHGGYDQGARGAGGSLEKDIALRLAFAVAQVLKPSYRVVITRTGDYRIDLPGRTSIANHQAADIFISIHTGGGSRYHLNTWGICYFKETPLMAADRGALSADPDDQKGYRRRWDEIQVRHAKAGKRLAECIKARLMDNHQISAVDLIGAPLRVLEGADMPAILFEAGHLTNPATEKRLNDPGFLARVAEDIRKGIDDFFNTEK